MAAFLQRCVTLCSLFVLRPGIKIKSWWEQGCAAVWQHQIQSSGGTRAGVAAVHQTASPRASPAWSLSWVTEKLSKSALGTCGGNYCPKHLPAFAGRRRCLAPHFGFFRHTDLNLKNCMLCICRKNTLICRSGNAKSPLY